MLRVGPVGDELLGGGRRDTERIRRRIRRERLFLGFHYRSPFVPRTGMSGTAVGGNVCSESAQAFCPGTPRGVVSRMWPTPSEDGRGFSLAMFASVWPSSTGKLHHQDCPSAPGWP